MEKINFQIIYEREAKEAETSKGETWSYKCMFRSMLNQRNNFNMLNTSFILVKKLAQLN